ncbi:MAG: hypothetical protein A2010_17145 [Nitrospirae bacterium GWD2_57_9]|nr:MAG: hypothetical protein A2010_17145 [Nitrospirae bacterium GWD2_57_9]
MEINMNPDVRVYWTATVIYGLAALLYVLSFAQKKENFAGLAIKFAWLGFLIHAVGTFYPAITHKYTHICSFYKVMGGTVVIGMFVFLAMAAVKKEVKPAALLILPLFFGLMVLGGMIPCHPLGPSPVYKGWQLWGHVTGAGFNFGFASLAAAVGILYLLKASGKTGYPYDKLPSLEILDRLNYRFVMVAFIFACAMVASASLWAIMKFGMVKKTMFLASIVWGFWSIYAAALGMRWFLHWQGKKLAVYSPVALLLVMSIMFYMAPFGEKNYHSGPFFYPYKIDSMNTDPGKADGKKTIQSGPVSVPQLPAAAASIAGNNK